MRVSEKTINYWYMYYVLFSIIKHIYTTKNIFKGLWKIHLPHILDVYTCTTFKHTVDNTCTYTGIYIKIIKTCILKHECWIGIFCSPNKIPSPWLQHVSNHFTQHKDAIQNVEGVTHLLYNTLNCIKVKRQIKHITKWNS